MVTTRPPRTIVKPTALGPVANTDTKLLIYGLFQKGRVLAQDEVRPFHSRTRWVPGETDPAGAPGLGVSFAMAARARRVVAECPPWVRHWRSYARTRHMKTRESERGGAAQKACSQTRRKLAKSKPSKTTFRPTPVSCGITERSLLCSIKSSLMRDFRVRSSLPVARPTADLSQPYAPPVGLSLGHPQPRGRKPALRREIPSILRGFQGRPETNQVRCARMNK